MPSCGTITVREPSDGDDGDGGNGDDGNGGGNGGNGGDGTGLNRNLLLAGGLGVAGLGAIALARQQGPQSGRR